MVKCSYCDKHRESGKLCANCCKLFWESDNLKYKIVFTPTGVRVDNSDMLTCDWPIQYSSGKVAYDHPEWFPKYVKSKMYNALQDYKEWREGNANN